MKTFKFQGNSDDTFGEYEQTDIDYDNSASGESIEFVQKYCQPGACGEGILYSPKYWRSLPAPPEGEGE